MGDSLEWRRLLAACVVDSIKVCCSVCGRLFVVPNETILEGWICGKCSEIEGEVGNETID